MNTTLTGRLYEDKTEEYLVLNGYEILSRNYKRSGGEIDIIAKLNNIISFVEVKYRKENSLVPAIETITKKKQERIKLTAMKYIIENELQDNETFFSFDVAVYEGKVTNFTYIKNAFY